MKKKGKRTLCVTILCGLLIVSFCLCENRRYVNANKNNFDINHTKDMSIELKTLLNNHNITVNGQSIDFTHFQLDGLIAMIPVEECDIIEKYTKISDECTGKIHLTYEQLFELMYYSSSIQARSSLLSSSENGTIQVLSDEYGTIGLGYNNKGTIENK